MLVNIMKEGKVKKARRKDSPKPAEPQPGARRTAKLLPGAEALPVRQLSGYEEEI